MTDIVLTPAACYPVYPAIAARGPLPSGGVMIDAGAAYVFRHEPSGDPARMQMFHQRELVRIGEPETSSTPGASAGASGPSRSSPALGIAGRARGRKRPVLRPRRADARGEPARPGAQVRGDRRRSPRPDRTAVASFNYHQDHFGEAFGIELHDGSRAHSACLGFGLERITLALFAAHGSDVRRLAAERAGATCGRDLPTGASRRA